MKSMPVALVDTAENFKLMKEENYRNPLSDFASNLSVNVKDIKIVCGCCFNF